MKDNSQKIKKITSSMNALQRNLDELRLAIVTGDEDSSPIKEGLHDLFVQTYALQPRTLSPYEHIGPSVKIGFEANSDRQVEIKQDFKPSFSLSPPEYLYSSSLRTSPYFSSAWLSLEIAFESGNSPRDLSIGMRARSEKSGEIVLTAKGSASSDPIIVGTLPIRTSYLFSSTHISIPPSNSEVTELIILLPAQAENKIDIDFIIASEHT